MDISIALPISGSWATPANVTEVARRAEDLGYAGLWTFQRLLCPAEGPPLAPVYHAVHDPVTLLSYAAAVTSRVRLGLAVVNMPFYAPVVLAKMLTTVDVLSGGRLDVGLGNGWNPAEFAAAGVPYERRGARAEDFLHCLYALWQDDPVAYEGPFYRVPPAHVRPKPVQRPRPPVLLGGGADAVLRRAGRLADGWVSGSFADLRKIADSGRVVRDAAAGAGRDPAAVRIVVRGVVRVRPGGAEERRPLSGSYEEIRADLATLAGQDVTEVFLDLNFDDEIGSPSADAERSMDRAREVLETLGP